MPAYIYPDESSDHLVTRTGHQTITGRKTFLAASATVVGLVVQAATSQSANLLEVKNSGGVNRAGVTANGALFSRNAVVVSTNEDFLGALFAANLHTSPAAKGMVIRGDAAQTGSLFQWQNSSGAVLGEFYADGRANFNSSTSDGAGVSGNGNAVNSFGGFFRSTVTQATPLMVRVVSGQAYDATQWQNANGNRMAAIDANGSIYTYNHNGLPSTVNSEFTMASFGGSVSNATSIMFKLIRASAGTDWGTADLHILRKTDATDQQRIVLGGGNGNINYSTAGTGIHYFTNSAGAGRFAVNSGTSITEPAANATASGLNHITFQLYSAAADSVNASSVLRFAGAGVAHGDLGFHSGASPSFRFHTTGSAYNGTAQPNGSVGVGTLFYSSLSSYSSIEFKDSVETLEVNGTKSTSGRRTTEETVISKMKKLRPVKYKLKNDRSPNPKSHHGFIAEEIAEVFPELAVRDDGEPNLVDPTQKPVGTGKVIAYDTQALLTMTVATLQDALARIEVLEAALAAK